MTWMRSRLVPWIPFIAASLTTLLVVAAVLLLDDLEVRRRQIAERAETFAQLDTVRAHLEHELNEPLTLSRGLVAFIRARGDITQAEFDQVAATLLRGADQGTRLSLARGTVIDMIYPLKGNEATLGVDYRTLPKQWPTVDRAIRTRAPALNGPVPLIQGGTGLIVRAPVFVPDPAGGADRFFGIVSLGLNMESVFAKAGLGASDLDISVAIRGRDGLGAAGGMITGDEAIFAQSPVTADVVMPYGVWRLAAIPKGGWGSAGRTEVLVLRGMGLLMVILVSAAAFGAAFYQRQRSRAEHTARLLLEAAVGERTAELRKFLQAVEQSPNAIVITDLDGVIEYVNGRFTQVTGYTPEEAIGQGTRILQSGDTSDEVYRGLWEAITTGRPWRGELKDRRKDGQIFWAEVSISSIRDEAGDVTHYLAIHEDITRRKLAEAEMVLAKEQAVVANRAKSEMLANMSHELRTPLNAIIGFSDSLLGGIFGPFSHPRQKEYIDDIHTSGLHLLQLINDILDVSAVEAGKLDLVEEELDVGEACASAMRLVALRAEKGKIRLSAEVPTTLPRLRADRRRLKQALLNLLSNAVKFTPENGSVVLSAREAADGGLDISVSDTGIGMDATDIARAMERFGQVDSGWGRKFEGTGLGLPLVKGLMELHGGTLTLASERTIGTTATVHFPSGRIIRS